METKITEFIKIDGQRRKISDFDLNVLTREKERLEDKIAKMELLLDNELFSYNAILNEIERRKGY
jgi:hypothetical protein